jgi:Hemagglutinin repeat
MSVVTVFDDSTCCANYRTWLGSDYMLSALNLDPATTQKRLGDGFYEQKLIREQVMALTGNRFLGDYSSDEQEFKGLMDAGVTYAKAMNLRPGIALSAEQVAQLTSDMVWLVSQDVTLADGTRQSVLVPQVYARVSPGDLDGSGALLSGKDVQLNTTGELSNSGTIKGGVAGRNLVQINAQSIQNMGGQISADTLALQAQEDINNVGGTLQAQSAALLSAGRDINVTTTVQSHSGQSAASTFSTTAVDRLASVYVKGSTGTLVASAGRDLNLTAAAVGNAGTGPTALTAGNNLSAVTTSDKQDTTFSANRYLRTSQSQDVGSQISAGGALTLSAGNDLNAKAGSVSAGQALSVNAGNNVLISAGEQSLSTAQALQVKRSGFLSSTTTTTRNSNASTTALGSTFEGQSVSINAGQDLSVKGSNVLADQNVQLNTGDNVNITAAQNTQSSSNFSQTTTSGVMSGGGIGVTVGSRMQSVDQQGQSTTAAGSTVGSTGGNVTINAGKTYTQTGSDVLTPAGDIAITAKAVDINEARETGSQSTEQKFKQSGVTVAVTSGLVSNLQMADKQLQAANNTSSDRMKALATVNAAAGVVQAAQNVTQLNVSITAGSSSSQSQQQSSADTAKGSNLNAGGNVSITATGAGKDSDITVRGSNIEAGKATSLKADDQVSLLAAANTTQESNSSKNSSASAGVSAGTGGLGVTASASAGKGNGSGNSTTYTNTQVSGNTVNIDSGGDTTLKGAVVQGDQVTANVGGKLQIESLQDRSTYQEKNSQAGGSVFVGAGASGPVSGNVNLAKTRINSDYTSVNEQSAIRAGDGGFNVKVQDKTELTGGQITSTQAAVDNNKNSYEAKQGTTTTDLQNSANYKASSVSVSVGVGSVPGQSASAGMSGVGFGSDKGSAQSTTTAGISGITGNTSARTGDKSNSIAPIFDKDRTQKEVAAQVAITSEFGKQASKAVGDYAGSQLKDLKSKANAETDPDKKAALLAEAAKWDEGGSARVALHAVVGGLTGGVQGAVGAGTSQAVIDQVGQALKETNLPTELKQALVLAAGTAVGAVASGGSVAGGATAFNATANNYLSSTDLRSRDQRLAAARKSGNVQEELNILKEYDAKSAKNTGAINYNSVLTEGSLQAEKAQLEQLVKDPATSAETKAQAQRSINELNTAINVIQKSPVLKDAAELGLIAADVLTLGELAAGKALTSALVKEFVAAKTGKVITDDVAAIVTSNFYKDGANPAFWTNGKIGDGSLNLASHWEKHASEFPSFKSANDYYRAASEFVSAPPSGTLVKTAPNGDVLLYNPSTNTFGVRTSDGLPKTMFKPDDGMTYWSKQRGQ